MKILGRILSGLSFLLALTGLIAWTGWIDQPFVQMVSNLTHKLAFERWTTNLHLLGGILAIGGAILAAFFGWVLPRLPAFWLRVNGWDEQLDGFLRRRLGRILAFQGPGLDRGSKTKSINRVDLVISILFFLFAIFYFLSKLQDNYPIVLLGGDAGNIASFAAAYDHPDLFKNDELLGNLDNIRIYNTLHIPLIRALNTLTGNYGLAYALLLIPHVFVHLLGYYLLGRILFKNRYWALLFTILVAVPVSINLQERWGFFSDALPRFTYQAIFPYLLSLTLVWKERPGRWPWLMAIAGVLFYAHPVSAPTGGLALWLGLWVLLPAAWSGWKRLAYMVGLGLVFLAAGLPFILNYFTHHVQGQTPDANLIYYVINNYFPANLLNVPAALADFNQIVWKQGILPLSILGLALTWILRRSERKQTVLILVWVAGLLLTSAWVPYILRIIEHYAHLAPIESELIRGIRYTIPFMLLFCLWPLSELSQRLKARPAGTGLAAAGLLLVTAWIWLHPVDLPGLGKALSCLGQGKLVCTRVDTTADAIKAVRDNREACDSLMGNSWPGPATDNALAIRYTALRPLVYAYKDRGLLGYSNPETLRNWEMLTNEFLKAREKDADPSSLLQKLAEIARQHGASCLLIDLEIRPEEINQLSLQVLYRNPTYTLVKVLYAPPSP